MAATTFHIFPYFPWELRARTWELSAEPRTVQVFTGEYGNPLTDASIGQKEYKCVFSSTPIPAMVQVCRESRNLGAYRQCLSEVERIPAFVPKESWGRYVWLNLDLDIVDIGTQDLLSLKMVATSIKRLKMEPQTLVDGTETLGLFENLEELHIVCPNEPSLGLFAFHWMFYHGRLDQRNVILIDKVHDQMTTLFDWIREAEERFEPHREELLAVIQDGDSEFTSEEEEDGNYPWLPIMYALKGYLGGQNGGGESHNAEGA